MLEAFAGIPAPAVVRVGVKGMPTSGKPADMLEEAGINAAHIAAAVRAAI